MSAAKNKTKVRVLFSQIEAEMIKQAGVRAEQMADVWNGHEINALKRALDKLALGLAGARQRDAERGVH